VESQFAGIDPGAGMNKTPVLLTRAICKRCGYEKPTRVENLTEDAFKVLLLQKASQSPAVMQEIAENYGYLFAEEFADGS
jgi:hypothetical protein